MKDEIWLSFAAVLQMLSIVLKRKSELITSTIGLTPTREVPTAKLVLPSSEIGSVMILSRKSFSM